MREFRTGDVVRIKKCDIEKLINTKGIIRGIVLDCRGERLALVAPLLDEKCILLLSFYYLEHCN